MKTKKIMQKLTLNKTTVTNLNMQQMNAIQGGYAVDPITPDCSNPCVLTPACAPTEGCPITNTCPSDCRTCSC